MDNAHEASISDTGASGGLYCCTFDERLSSLTVGRACGYSLYSINTTSSSNTNLSVRFNDEVYEDVIIAEHLPSSALMLIVSRRSPRKLRVHNFEKDKEMGTYSYSNNILAVKLNLLRVVVCLERTIHVHNIRTMKEIFTIEQVAPNYHGLAALSSAETSYIAYATSSTCGQVDVFDAVNLCVVQTIAAHDSPLAALTLNRSGSLLATASNKGTVIRVFSLPIGDRLFEFSRGITRCATIYSLSFSLDSTFLTSSSNTQTVHIFKIPSIVDSSLSSSITTTTANSSENCNNNDNKNTSCNNSAESSEPYMWQSSLANGYAAAWIDYLSRAVTNYLPTQMSDILQRETSFAYARLPALSSFSSLALIRLDHTNGTNGISCSKSARNSAENKDDMRLLVASIDGFLYCYSVPSSGGGCECKLIEQHNLLQLHATPQVIAQSSETAILRPHARDQHPSSTAFSQYQRSVPHISSHFYDPHSLRINDLDEFPPI